ncbi:MAG: hypothetical protein ACE5KA_09300 [Nitrososphaerales archaeon]
MRSKTRDELTLKAESLLAEADWMIDTLERLDTDHKLAIAKALRVATIDELDSILKRIMKEVEMLGPPIRNTRYFNETIWIQGRRHPIIPDFRFRAMRFFDNKEEQLRERSKSGQICYVQLDEFLEVLQALRQKVSTGAYDEQLYEHPAVLLFKVILSFVQHQGKK